MSVFLNTSIRFGVAGTVAMLSMPSFATIVIDGNAGRSQMGMVMGRSVMGLSTSSYAVVRSHAWMNYQREDDRTGRGLVAVPLAGAWMSFSPSQANARSHVARAQTYRLMGRE